MKVQPEKERGSLRAGNEVSAAPNKSLAVHPLLPLKPRFGTQHPLSSRFPSHIKAEFLDRRASNAKRNSKMRPPRCRPLSRSWPPLSQPSSKEPRGQPFSIHVEYREEETLNMSSSSLIRMTPMTICVSAAAGTHGMVRPASPLWARQEGSKTMERQIAEMAINSARADG